MVDCQPQFAMFVAPSTTHVQSLHPPHGRFGELMHFISPNLCQPLVNY